ncbi:MAG TPA: thiol-disulfide isomerase [Bryobacteraceae bacterium]
MLLRSFLLALAGAITAAASLAANQGSPTFYKDVLPILQQHCQECHRPGEAAPMPLLTYKQTRPWIEEIRGAVASRRMPPWFADPQFGTFANDRRLSQVEIGTIVHWIDAGAPAGDPRQAPKPRHWVAGWSIGKPDTVFEMPAAFQIPASGTLAYRYVIVPTHFKRDRWVRMAEVRPEDREHTHHIVVSVRKPGSPWFRDRPIGIPFTLKPGDDDQAQGPFLAGYGPGDVPEILPPGDGKLIPAGSDLVFQLHCTTDGKPGREQSRIGLVFLHRAPKHRVLMLAAANTHILIPPYDPDYRAEARLVLHHAATLISLLPHMHMRGKSFEFQVVYPDGRRQTLLIVPHYSYRWQLTYYLKKPLHLPAGSAIECIAQYDNSPSNPHNPDAARYVGFGPQMWDEMMIGFFQVAVAPEVNMRELLLPLQQTHSQRLANHTIDQ